MWHIAGFFGSPDDGPGVPMNVVIMNNPQHDVAGSLFVLSLKFEVVDDRPDYPVVRFLVDGRDPFAVAAPGSLGYDPAKILGPRSPLLPEDQGRRVALYYCPSGGWNVIAPMIVPSPDGRRVSWVDFRDPGFFAGPIEPIDAAEGGRPWDLPDLHFDREQYVAEIERASAYESWETDRRRTARLLCERLQPLKLVLPPDLGLAWASTPGREDGVTLMFQRVSRTDGIRVRQQMLRLTSTLHDPGQAAQDMAEQLLSTSPDDWADSFGYPSA
jgi:hypothetical protein